MPTRSMVLPFQWVRAVWTKRDEAVLAVKERISQMVLNKEPGLCFCVCSSDFLVPKNKQNTVLKLQT